MTGLAPGLSLGGGGGMGPFPNVFWGLEGGTDILGPSPALALGRAELDLKGRLALGLISTVTTQVKRSAVEY